MTMKRCICITLNHQVDEHIQTQKKFIVHNDDDDDDDVVYIFVNGRVLIHFT